MRTKRKTSRVLAKLLSFVLAVSFILSSALTVSAAQDYDPDQVDYRSVMYYGDWSIWGGQGNHYPTTLPVENYTHLNFAFLDFDSNGNLMFTDPDAALVAPVGMNVTWGGANAGILSAFQDLRARNTHLRIGVSVGGWSKSGDFSAVAANPTTRAKFVNNLVQFLVLNNMDYLDIDWEYPCDVRQPDLVDNMRDEGTPYATPADKQNYILLLQDLRAALDAQGEEDGRVYELSIALPAPKARIALGYDLLELMKVLDFINIMTYDMAGAWNAVSGHHTALYTNPADPFINDGFSVDASVNYILDVLREQLEEKPTPPSPQKIDELMAKFAKKLVVGYALYTRGWERVDDDGGAVDDEGPLPGLFGTAHLVNPSANNVLAYGAANLAPLVSGDGGHLSGVWSYGTLAQLHARYPGLKEEWDNVAKAPYLYNPTTGTFFTYDNPRSVTEKGEYVKANGLGGLIGWMASQDATTSTGKRDELSTVAWNVLFGNASRPSYNIGPAAISVTVSLSNYTANGRNGYNVTLTNTATLTETDSVLRAVESRAKTVKLPKIYFITESNATFTTGGYPTGAVSNVDGVGIVDMATVYDNQFLAPGRSTTFKVLTNGAAEISDITCICLSQRITPTGPEISKQCVYGSCEDPIDDPDPVDEEPVITGAVNVTIEEGTPFDPMDGVEATDEEDGDLTSEIVVTGTVDVNTPGTYTLVYTVTDSGNNTVTFTRVITVLPEEEEEENTPPVISGVSNKTITVGDSFNPMQGVSASDAEDGNLTSAIVVTGSVNTAVAGTYTLTYTVTDSGGLKDEETCVITVEADEPEEPEVPGNYDPNKTYVAGDLVDYNGETYRAKWWVRGGGTPDVNPAFERITNNGNNIAEWNADKAYVAGDKVTYNGQTYEAQWWTRGNAPGSNSVWKLV